jgi:glycosyltransferase involved in cell wall biosynthesis
MPGAAARIEEDRALTASSPPLLLPRCAPDLKVLLPEHDFGSPHQHRTFCDLAPGRAAREGASGDGSSGDEFPGSIKVFIDHAGSSYRESEALFQRLAANRAQTISVGDLLQRLEDPRPLLRTLRGILQLNRENRVLASIFDPGLPASARDPVRPSAESTCIRLWTRDQARAFLEACGFHIVGERPLPPREAGGSACNYSFTLSCSDDHYRSHLARHGLPPATLEYLLFATEHSACKVTGGIGSYVEQMEDLLPPEKFGLCYVGHPSVLPEDAAADRSWILPSVFLDAEEWQRLSLAELALRQLQVLAFLYPGLKCVEFQEYLGIGHLAPRARRAGLLPADLSIKTRCHGSQIYLESCFSRWTAFEHLEVAYQEKVAIEEADVVSLPSRFLLEMYRSRGYRIEDSKVEIRKYPFDFSPPSRPPACEPLDTLLFFGKRTAMKGFPAFVEALSRLVQDPGQHGLRRAVVIGRLDRTLEQENRRLAELADKIEVIEFEGSRAQAIGLIEKYAGSALCTMPYQSDNYPMAVLEAASTGCAVLAANTGGIPEMIPEEFHWLVLHEAGAEGLYQACLRVLDLPPEKRSSLTQACLGSLAEAYLAVNADHLSDHGRAPVSSPERTSRSTVGVIVPCFNSKLEHIRDLVYGLNAQTHPPDEVCFVDDGSRDGFSAELQTFLAGHLAVPFRVVRHHVNRGLASARNTGLRALSTDYVVNVDSDDIPKADFIRDYVDYLDDDTEVVAVTSWLESFRDGTNWFDAANCFLMYKPLGDGLMLAQTQNCLGHANSAFRRDHLLSIGGWDGTDKSMWEDWALFLRILSAGRRIGVVPKSNILYRVNDASMVRTHAPFPAMNRLARNLGGLATFEAYRLQALMRGYEDLRQNHERLRQRHDQIEEQLHTNLSFRIARRCAEFANRHPLLKKPAKKLFLLVEGTFDRRRKT